MGLNPISVIRETATVKRNKVNKNGLISFIARIEDDMLSTTILAKPISKI